MHSLQALEIPPGPPTPQVLAALTTTLSGRGPLLLPHAPGEQPPSLSGPGAPLTGGGLAVATSGSTGTPKRAVLTAVALRSSAEATHEHLGGPGRWLLALPGHHIAGLQVTLRSLAAGHAPAATGPGRFTPELFVAAVRGAGAPRPRYTSLVPTQLARLLRDPEACAALADFETVLLGGAAPSAALLQHAHEAGVRVVVTYGMSETAGGCVYDGTPLRGVGVDIVEGVIHLGGPTLAQGYLDPAADTAVFFGSGEQRRLRTGDLGRFDGGRLIVLGRADDVIITGALKVWPGQVEQAVAALWGDNPAVAAVGVPDPEWGEVVGLVVATPDARGYDRIDGLARLRADLREHLPAHALPRRLHVVDELPSRGPGKPDRAALRALFQRRSTPHDVG